MKNQIATLFSCVLLASAVDAGAECRPQTVDRIAIRLFPAQTMAQLDIVLEKQSLTATQNPNLPGVWIYTNKSPYTLDKIKSLTPTASCMDFKTHSEPRMGLLSDNQCYAIFEFDATPSCWSIRVKSKPYGHPFQVTAENESKARKMRREENGEDDWNLETDLPRQSATIIDIYEQAKPPKRRLLAIGPLTFVRLLNSTAGNDKWVLSREELAQYVDETRSGEDTKKKGNFDETMRQDLRKWLMKTDPLLKNLQEIDLSLGGK